MFFNPFLSVIIISILMFSCQHETKKSKLEQAVKNVLARQKGTFAVAFKNIATGEALLINEREKFHAASTMKTPVMIEVFKQAEEGKFSLQDSVVVKNEFKSIVDNSLFSLNPEDDSDQELYQKIRKKSTISALVYDMIIISSNLATNIVIEFVNARKVNETMRTIGANEIEILRGVEDSKAFEKGMNNTTTAYDLMLIFEKIANEEMVSRDASQSMIRILLDQKFNEIIPAKLPKDVKVAHKTGNITGVQHDSGIVFLPDGQRYVLVLLSKNIEDEKATIESLATVSAMVYKYMVGE